MQIPEGGARRVNKFMLKVIDHVSDEVLMLDSPTPFKFPLFEDGNTVGEVCIEEAAEPTA